MRSLRRFESLGLLDVLSRSDAALTFDLADDFRGVWAGVLATAGQQQDESRAPVSSARGFVPQVAAGHDPAIFLSVAETQKESLARPFRALLAKDGLKGIIVSDEPLPEGAFTPEEKVDAYLERSNAVIVFATADLEAEEDLYTRPNIADEIARARSKAHLRSRVCVLRQRKVILPSNINPAYERLDPAEPGEGYRRALLQLRAWGFDVTVPQGASQQTLRTVDQPAEAKTPALSLAEQQELLVRAEALLPDRRHAASEMSLALVLTTGPRQALLRPAQLEAADLAKRLTQQLLFGDPALFDSSEGTDPRMSGSALVIRQSRAWIALDSEASIVVLRPLRRNSRQPGLPAVIEEDVRSGILDMLRFDAQLLQQIDPDHRVSTVVPMVALVGASYGAWRTREEHAASPNSMAMNIAAAAEEVVAHLTPPGVDRASLTNTAAELAEDLMVLLRRAAIRR